MIHTEQLTKHFVSKKETVEAVKGVDIDVAAGELVAFLGPNGAGKSTTLRMLTTLLPPTSGTAWVAGREHHRRPAAVRSRIGYIGQGNGAGHSFRVRDELVSQGRFYGMNSADAQARADELVGILDLAGLAKRTGQHAVRRPAPPAGHRARADAQPVAALPRRAVDRDGPAEPGQPVGAHRRLRDRAGHHHRADHPLPGGGRRAGRAGAWSSTTARSSPTTRAADLKATLAGDRITVTVDAGAVDAAAAVLGDRRRRPEPDAGRLGSRCRGRFEQGTRTLPGLLRELRRTPGSTCSRPTSACRPWTTCSSA